MFSNYANVLIFYSPRCIQRVNFYILKFPEIFHRVANTVIS